MVKITQKGIIGYAEGFIFHCPKCAKGFECAAFFVGERKASCMVCQSELLIRRNFESSSLAVKFDTSMSDIQILDAIERKRLTPELDAKLSRYLEFETHCGRGAIETMQWTLGFLRKDKRLETYVFEIQQLIVDMNYNLQKIPLALTFEEVLMIGHRFEELTAKFLKITNAVSHLAQKLNI